MERPVLATCFVPLHRPKRRCGIGGICISLPGTGGGLWVIRVVPALTSGSATGTTTSTTLGALNCMGKGEERERAGDLRVDSGVEGGSLVVGWSSGVAGRNNVGSCMVVGTCVIDGSCFMVSSKSGVAAVVVVVSVLELVLLALDNCIVMVSSPKA